MHRTILLSFLAILASCGTKQENNITDKLHSDSLELVALNELIDTWHQASATANQDVFFGAMSPDAVYLGTDPSERWLRDELRDWARDAFSRPSAWAFTPSNRECFLAPGGQVAWFHELLKTDMGPCRGSGVLTKTPNGWLISHYNLSFVLENEKVPAFITLAKGE